MKRETKTAERGHWTGKCDFFFSALGFAVGLTNIWKFPYLCYKYGGGAFLLPYIFMLFLVGIPMFLVELTIGQFSAFTPIKCFSNMAPVLAGIGMTSFLESIKDIVSYNMIIAWSLYYLGLSFKSDLPWTHCGQAHNTQRCYSDTEKRFCIERNDSNVYFNGTCFDAAIAEREGISEIPPGERISASEEYMKHSVLGITSGLEELGTLQWRLVLSYFAAWVLIFLCLCKGIRSSGKVVYFTATFPYVVLVALLVRGVTLPGAMDGIRFYIVPQWDKVMNIKVEILFLAISRLGRVFTSFCLKVVELICEWPYSPYSLEQVWEQALAQILGSLSLGGGGLITLASYNRFRYNLIRDTWMVSLGNSFTSIFGGFAIFSTLGFMAHQLEVPVDQVRRSVEAGKANGRNDWKA
ncbi:unnamed protein product [Darwinula stevensoni]|uniref:Transporter n=1 Tax=Darwinula stevensoni TaxID=69355 RepID=A0A7R9FNX2_9CRUS|nr:unnamed protein product [Darwinula stevensoni]CAG0896895.1 unnamed protein product [Darwinula stevensoni]